ncbi:LuxE/PaaK family acyltransferase [Rhizorhapis sp. SPR117]|uniref:LuxE/PaaK family acyltransferase n=1 Tax=Rhizorhapis sp. SPR117 TaxID=2912611 RepID=UPI001F30250F|nr:hypothetical protein [Rhizorhapis sp. SPR117]
MRGLIEQDADPIGDLLRAAPYGLPEPERQRRLLAAMNSAYRHHVENCAAYRHFCAKRGFGQEHVFTSLTDFPFLPAQAFKENSDVLRSVDLADIRSTLSSSATSGIPSAVVVDAITAKRQVRALTSVVSEALGGKRRPLLVLDVPPGKDQHGGLGARGAAVRGFLNLASEVQYFMDIDANGSLVLQEQAFADALSSLDGPAMVFGFTYVLYAFAVEPLLRAGRGFSMPAGSHVVHIGGWKKLADQRVSPEVFDRAMRDALGVPADHVIDFYGFTEQMGVTYPTGPEGDKHCPAFAEVIVRDPATYEPVRDGEEGLLEFLTPLPHSYPGIAVLTDDVGMITGRPRPGDIWGGTRFRVLGRAKKAEVRGCGDIMGEKMAPQAVQQHAAIVQAPSNVRLLWEAGTNHVAGDLQAPVDTRSLPVVADINALAAQLRDRRTLLDSYSSDELITLIAAASRKWAAGEGPLAPLRQQGLLFLTSWCASGALRRLADDSLRGQRGHLDGFLPCADHGRAFLRAMPRGLVSHWLAGNVPLLGMLALVQAIICRNANLIKAASSFSRALPALLDAFRGLEVPTAGGRILKGDDILQSIAIVYFDRLDRAAAEHMSETADVRIAWGGAEAVAGILTLPRPFSTEDIIFGPKLSYMVIGRDRLDTPRNVRKLARAAAIDASVFDQYACASPHNIFVEEGGDAASPREFAALLAEEMEKAAIRIPKAPADPGTISAIQSARLRQELTGEVWASQDSTWTVLFNARAPSALEPPRYSRVISVSTVSDGLACADFASPDIQTIGLAMAGPRRLAFAERAALRGAVRFPDIGRMTHFQSPWDGLFPMDRLVRWVSMGGPF